MEILSSWHRWIVYLKIEKDIKYCIKKAKTIEKKWAIKKEIVILNFLKDKVHFVPEILEYWDDYFKYRFIEWITFDKIKNPSNVLYHKLIQFSYELDKLKVEHWELSKPTKNIIVKDENLYIIDFERWNLSNHNGKNLKWLTNFFYNKWFIDLKSCKKINNFKSLEEICLFLKYLF